MNVRARDRRDDPYMLTFTGGLIVALAPTGFRIATRHGIEEDIYTETSGFHLNVAIGDRVQVYGRPTADGRGFTSSSLYVCLPSGELRHVRDELRFSKNSNSPTPPNGSRRDDPR
jgi:hypothetical protein